MIAALLWLAAVGAPDGADIARRADAQDSGWRSEVLTARMTMVRPSGRQDSRTFRMTLVEGIAGAGEASLIELMQPARHKGLKVLTRTGEGGRDAVWVRFPAHGRTRRIVGRKRTGRFLGSELTYEDLGSRRSDRYEHVWLRDEPIDGVACHVVRTTPKDPDTGYSKMHVWREVDSLRLRRVEYFGRDGHTLLKVGDFTEYQVVPGRSGLARPDRYVVRDPESGRRTELVFRDRKIGVALPADALTLRALER